MLAQLSYHLIPQTSMLSHVCESPQIIILMMLRIRSPLGAATNTVNKRLVSSLSVRPLQSISRDCSMLGLPTQASISLQPSYI